MWLLAYPWIKHPAVLSVPGKPQVYTGQDRHDPTGLYPHSTRKERQQMREKERQALSQNIDHPAYNHGQALEYQRYNGETLVQRWDQPWPWRAETDDDPFSLERCDDAVMKAIQESGLLPRMEGGFNPITPSYLTVVLDQDKALLTDQEAMNISMAFPYA